MVVSILQVALESIISYVLPVYTFDGEKYVKLQHAKQLKQFAKDALSDTK